MKFIVTGSCGFIGSHLCEKLLKKGAEVIGIDNLNSFYSSRIKKKNIDKISSHPKFTFHEIDLNQISNILFDTEVDCLFHLAASPGVRYSFDETEACIYNNINVTQKVLDFCIKRKIKKVIFASSSSVYGVNSSVPWKENEKLIPISPYAYSKLSCESLGEMYSKIYDLKFISLRFFTVYGPRQRPDLAIHKFFKSITSAEKINVFGSGNTYRDYTFIDDIISGIINSIQLKNKFEIINLGSGNPIKILELIKLIEKITSKKANLEFIELPVGDVPKTFADITKASKILGYEPKIDFECGLKIFYKWFLKKD